MKIELKGVPAVIAGVILVAVAISYQLFLHGSLPQDPELRRQLEVWLMCEIGDAISADVEAIKAAMAKGDNAKASQLVEGTLQRKVEIKDLAMRGSGENIIVKANYTVDGPGGPEARVGYYRCSHSMITGWRFHREVSSFSWYTKLF